MSFYTVMRNIFSCMFTRFNFRNGVKMALTLQARGGVRSLIFASPKICIWYSQSTAVVEG